MNLKSKFLSLPIKNQICIAIITLNIFCIISIMLIFGALAYQILKEDYKKKRLYFYVKYQEYIESCFYFQNFCLLQYEELIKRIQIQIREVLKAASIYNYKYNINNNILNKIKVIDFNQNFSIEDLEQENNDNDNDYLYYNCFDVLKRCLIILDRILMQYNAVSSLVSSHNINNKFNIPMLDNVAIMDDPVFHEILSYSIFSFSLPKFLKQIYKIFGNENNVILLRKYLDIKIGEIFDEINDYIDLVLLNPHSLIELFFDKPINNIKQEFPDYINFYKNKTTFALLKVSSLFPKIDYGNNQFSLFEDQDNLALCLYIESNLIDNYLYFMNNKISSFIDLYFIPLYSENNTIISPDLSILFLLKQVEFQITQEEIDELFKKIVKGKSKIQDCIKDFELLKNKLEINDIFNLNHSFFILVSNSSINQGILNLDNSNYYFMKYSYPSYSTLVQFKPEYFYKNQINFYAFSSLKEMVKYIRLLLQISTNCFNLFTLLILYIWLFCLLINIFIFNKVIKQIIEPIENLQEALISNSIKNPKIFEYEYDDIINELFLTSKEYLSGQIDKNSKEKGLDILNSISKEKSDTEENKFINNLRINNYIMNKLINEQEILMDFSKYIEINENNNLQNDGSNNSSTSLFYDKKINLSNNHDNNNKLNNNIHNKSSFKFQREEKEKENREFFKKLFQISEYLYLFLNEKKQKLIKIKDNEINDESTISNISKNEKFSQNTSSAQDISNYYSTIRKHDSNLLNKDNQKSFFINIMDKDDMTFLWYEEAKKRNNRSLNYKIGKNYDELFND